MLSLLRTLVLLLATLAGFSQAAPLVAYQNTDTDTGQSVMFSAGPFSGIGDQVQLTAAGRIDRLGTQFFNAGSDATFDAELQFYNVTGSGFSAIGGPFGLTGIVISAFQSLDVEFDLLGGLHVPADLVVMLAVRNVSAGGDIGLNLFDAPTVGTSDSSFFLTDSSGGGIVQASTLMDIDNLNLRITTAVPVPAPATGWLVLLPLAAMILGRRRAA